jgi:hypothetical protein
MRHLKIALVLFAAFGLVACGGDGSSPSTPSIPVLTTQSLTVTMSSPVAVGSTAQATAVATMSNGTTQTITSGFKSDVPSVATVTDSGMVTAVAAGAANIYVVAGGQQGTRNIRGVPSYAGSWSGSYYITGCSHSGIFAAANMCDTFSPNKVYPYNMNLSQSGESVSGAFAMGTLVFSQSASTIDGGGQIVLNGNYYSGTTSINAAWTLTCPAAGRLSGTVQHVWRDSAYSGQLVVTGTIRDSMKAASPVATSGSGLEDALRIWQQFIRR